jgi:hypothetical protein
MKRSPLSVEDERELMATIWDPRVSEHPRRFVELVYPWGKEGTPLQRHKEPRKWQIEEWELMADHISANKQWIDCGLDPLVYQSSNVTGRGVGKSAFMAMTDHWFRSTVIGGSGLYTANTETQLRSKTWPEFGKWHTLALNQHWFEKNALDIRLNGWFEEQVKKEMQIGTDLYMSRALTWSAENTDAFAGQHNDYGTIIGFDEASGIPKPIWDVTEGFFTEPVLHRYWFVFSNGRRNTGPFFECFHANRKYWHRRNLDSRTVEGTDKTLLNQIVEKNGEDSDVARVEVRGMFPRQGDRQFISREVVEDARIRELESDNAAPLIMGVDPARFGDDSTVIRFRQGRDARSIPPIVLNGRDNMEVAATCAEWINKANPDAVCVDAGNGTGIIDRLRALGFKVHEVWFGSSSSKPEYADKRTELWADMRDWLGGAAIDLSEDLHTDLTAPEYDFVGAEDKVKLESKEKLKARGFASPDNADALACTFAVKVARKDRTALAKRAGRKDVRAKDVDYKVLG